MKDIIIPTGSRLTRKLEEDQIAIHSPKRGRTGTITFYIAISVLMMVLLALAVITSIPDNVQNIAYTLPVWPIAIFMFRVGRKASALEEWVTIYKNELQLRKQSFSSVKEKIIPLDKIKSVDLSKANFLQRLSGLSLFLRNEGEYGSAFPTIHYKSGLSKKATFFENATSEERAWIVELLRERIFEQKD